MKTLAAAATALLGSTLAAAADTFRIELVGSGAHAARPHEARDPIVGAAGVIAATVHFFKDPISEWPFVLVFLALVASLAFLMVSRVRYPSFKAFDLRRRRSFLTIILIGLIVLGVWAFSEQVLLILALVYASSGPVSRLVSKIRPHPPAPKEVHAS